MLTKFKQGFKSGLMVFFGLCFSGLFAYTVSGTIKTWTTGDTLTATDLNTTVQSLKTAVESASQVGTVAINGTAPDANTYYPSFLGNTRVTTESQMQWPATRAGTVKSARVIVGSNGCTGGPFNITLRKNGVDTAISIAVPASSVAQVTDPDTVAFAAGDLLSWKTQCPSNGMMNSAQVYFEF